MLMHRYSKSSYACLLFASKTLQDASFIPIAAEAV